MAPRGMGVDQYLDGLRQHESGGRNIPNQGGHTSASGLYQYTDGTWDNYGGYDRAMDAPRSVQHERARRDALQSYEQHGDWERVAMSHFYPAWADDPKSSWGRTPAPGNPTGREFVSSVMSNAGGSSGGPGGPPSSRSGNSGGGASSMDFEVPDYPSTPAPLSRDAIRRFGERRRAASRALDTALAKRDRGSAQADQRLQRRRAELDRQAEETEDDQRVSLSARGMARQPAGIGKALQSIRDDKSAGLAEAQRSKADRLSELDFAVNEARSQRDNVRAGIRADQATERTVLDKLIGGSQ